MLILKIVIKRLRGEDRDYLDIVVSDNGCGYGAEWLEKMNQVDLDDNEGAHIGILNLKRRLQLHYGEAAECVVRNDHGAISEVVLPIEKDEDNGEGVDGLYECSGS